MNIFSVYICTERLTSFLCYSLIDWVSRIYFINIFCLNGCNEALHIFIWYRDVVRTLPPLSSSSSSSWASRLNSKKLLPYILHVQQCMHFKEACKHEIKLKNICVCNAMRGNDDNFLKFPITLSFLFPSQ